MQAKAVIDYSIKHFREMRLHCSITICSICLYRFEGLFDLIYLRIIFFWEIQVCIAGSLGAVTVKVHIAMLDIDVLTRFLMVQLVITEYIGLYHKEAMECLVIFMS